MRALDIPAYSGRAIEVHAHEHMRITDVEGCQIADMFAVSTADMTEWLSAAHTRAGTSRLRCTPIRVEIGSAAEAA